jgi:hypothetical protein
MSIKIGNYRASEVSDIPFIKIYAWLYILLN